MAIVAAGSLSGCGVFNTATQTRVRLVNDSSFPVDVTLFYSSRSDDTRPALTTSGNRLEFNIAAGESASFARPCTELRAIVIENAELRVLGSEGPETETNVLAADGDFGCASTITYTFDHSDVVVDFNVATRVDR